MTRSTSTSAIAVGTATLLAAALLAPVAVAHEERAKDRADAAATWTRASVLEAEVVDASDTMSHVANITYELRYEEPIPHGTDIEFATLTVPGETDEAPSTPIGELPGDAAEVVRVAGADRVATAAEVSRRTFERADTVIVARSDVYADALAGAPLATEESAPLLLTGSSALAEVTADEIERLGASRAVLLGGELALSDEVESAIEDLGVTTERVAGGDRFGTAAKIHDALPTTDRVLVVEGADADPARGWPDALSASGWAATTGMPILLVTTDTLPDATADKLAEGRDATVIGGTVAVSDAVETQVDELAGAVDRIAGADRYATSAAVARAALEDGASASTTFVATGRAFADGLVAGPAVGATGGLLVLVDGQDADGAPATRQLLREVADDVDELVVTGGEQAISRAVEDRLRAIVTDDDATSRASTRAHQQPGGTRDFAIAGSYYNGMHIIDIADPEKPEIASIYDCGLLQGDVQVFTRDGRTYATYTSENSSGLVVESQCVQDAVSRGDIEEFEENEEGEVDDKSAAYGTYVVDITNPYEPVSAGFIPVIEGSHNGTVHPSGDFFYNSDSALVNDETPQIQIYDIRDLSDIKRVGVLDTPFFPGLGSSSHDITFSEDGTRGYSAALSNTIILDTTDPANPTIISSFMDESIETEHGIKPFTITGEDGEEREFIAVADEVIGALPGNVCPGGGVHFYDITGDNENDPLANKVGVFFIPEQRLAGPEDPLFGTVVEDEFGESGTCTAHVMRVHEDAPGGPVLTMAWYNAGVRVLDLSGLADAPADPTGMPVEQVGHIYLENSDTWSFKTNAFEADGSFYGYGNDILRGFDVYRYDASATTDAEAGNGGIFLTPAEALRSRRAATWPGWEG